MKKKNKKIKKKLSKLQKAIKHTDNLPDSWFGTETASLSDLPVIKKGKK